MPKVISFLTIALKLIQNWHNNKNYTILTIGIKSMLIDRMVLYGQLWKCLYKDTVSFACPSKFL